jgi:hypothetical protein
LRRQDVGLRVIRRVVQETIAALSRHNVEDCALDVAVLRRDANRLDLDFLDDVDTRLGARDARTRACEIRAVDRNRFSLPPVPNAETVLTVPLDGDVGDMPGAALIGSNMLNRRDGIEARYSGPNRVSNPLLRASSREPGPWTTIDAAMPASFNTTVRSSVAPAPILTSSSA